MPAMPTLVVCLLALLASVGAGCQDSLVTRSIGARCDISDECDERCLPESEGFPGGFCTISCNTRDECTVSTTCVELQGGVCLYACDDGLDCRFLGDGWSCIETELRDNPDVKVSVCTGS